MLSAACTTPDFTSRSVQPIKSKRQASASSWVILFAKHSVFAFGQRSQPAKRLAQPQLSFPLGIFFHLLPIPHPLLFFFLLPYSHRAHVLKTDNENLLSSLNPYFRNLFFLFPGSFLIASPDTEGSVKPVSRQGCESQWKGHFKVTWVMKTLTKKGTYVCVTSPPARSLRSTSPAVAPEQHRHLPDLLWCFSTPDTLCLQYSRCWERELLKLLFYFLQTGYYIFHGKKISATLRKLQIAE